MSAQLFTFFFGFFPGQDILVELINVPLILRFRNGRTGRTVIIFRRLFRFVSKCINGINGKAVEACFKIVVLILDPADVTVSFLYSFVPGKALPVLRQIVLTVIFRPGREAYGGHLRIIRDAAGYGKAGIVRF